MKEVIRIILVDDHSLFRSGLKNLLNEMGEFAVIEDYGDPISAIQNFQSGKADLVLLDVNMPGVNGIDFIERFRMIDPAIKIMMLTISQEGSDLFGAIQNGADGYLLKNIEPNGLKNHILNVIRGNSVLSPEVTKSVLSAVRKSPNPQIGGLSDREVEVLGCMFKGLKTSQISGQLFISENTVKTHIRHILKKLNVKNRAEAVSKGIKNGLI